MAKPHLIREWCLSELTASFVWQMEKLLALYALPYDPLRPLWCFAGAPLLVEPGKPQRRNYEYERHGVGAVLLAVQLHTGRGFVQV